MRLQETRFLVSITESDQTNKDGKFLDEIKNVFDKYETSAQFNTAWNQLKNLYRSAQNSFKKRMRNEKSMHETWTYIHIIAYH